MESLGLGILISTILYIDYKEYLRCGNSIFFKDKTEIEKELRDLQKLEVTEKINKLKNKNKS